MCAQCRCKTWACSNWWKKLLECMFSACPILLFTPFVIFFFTPFVIFFISYSPCCEWTYRVYHRCIIGPIMSASLLCRQHLQRSWGGGHPREALRVGALVGGRTHGRQARTRPAGNLRPGSHLRKGVPATPSHHSSLPDTPHPSHFVHFLHLTCTGSFGVRWHIGF